MELENASPNQATKTSLSQSEDQALLKKRPSDASTSGDDQSKKVCSGVSEKQKNRRESSDYVDYSNVDTSNYSNCKNSFTKHSIQSHNTKESSKSHNSNSVNSSYGDSLESGSGSSTRNNDKCCYDKSSSNISKSENSTKIAEFSSNCKDSQKSRKDTMFDGYNGTSCNISKITTSKLNTSSKSTSKSDSCQNKLTNSGSTDCIDGSENSPTNRDETYSSTDRDSCNIDKNSITSKKSSLSDQKGVKGMESTTSKSYSNRTQNS
ncbi:uncharacterized protein CMU_016670 [Cryptosporidium muris RN66]|uniref:Uncharacterized protein n=1 Tax=Cryptosporidium muris (strain RN66) TaxID=441375 RepID=B6ACR3_CRYMR|nr:uncharacterized protein CMU_016670 [Cryptosporidium muris RN66]EEA05917.1 hypothetical protein CMU_016670 [Cryptosporidium muris RN66]|eukprot:XP_002140266.1 hypothetical protein [Cryptosporidium muris RN66]